MCTLYENIMKLCAQKGITGAKLCSEIGISKGLITDLKMGRRTGVSAKTADKIAQYFNVSVSSLLGTEQEKPPVDNERLSDDALKFALFGDATDITDADIEDVRRYAEFIKERKKKNK